MKPLNLKMQAFGPFAGSQTIDFTQLGSNPLFLINGPTGSGKTSILDALCYALYGETTGNERDGAQMRCELAAAELATEVVLEFSLHQQRYRVARSPEQQVPKARGEGFTLSKHKASLYRITEADTLLTSKTSEVKAQITTLIGLSETQFRQVMVLPQGKFRELLLASSKEREDIFGQLFQTDIYKQIEYALKEQAAQISKSKNEFDNQIRGALQVAGETDEKALQAAVNQQAVALEQARVAEQQAASTVQQLRARLQQAQTLNAQFSRKAQAQASLHAHLQSEDSINQQATLLESALDARRIRNHYDQWQQSAQQQHALTDKVSQLQQQLDAAKTQHHTAEEALGQARQRAEQIDSLTAQQYQLEQVKQQLQERQATAQHIKRCEAAQLTHQQNLDKYQHVRQALEDKTTQATQALEQARQETARLGEVNGQIHQSERLIKDARRLTELDTRIAQCTKQTMASQQQTEDSAAQSQSAGRQADQLELHWHSSQAAALAAKLESAQPCPVCGSQEHPAPASFTGDPVSRVQVQKARQQAQQLADKASAAHSTLAQHRHELAQLKQQYTELADEIGEQGTCSLADLQQQLTDLQARLASIKAIDLTTLEDSLTALKQRCKNGDATISELRDTQVTNNTELVQYQQQYHALSKKIASEYQDDAAVDAQIAQVKAQISEMNQAVQHAMDNEQQAVRALSQYQGELASSQQYLTQATAQAKQAEETWQQTLDASRFATQQAFTEALAHEPHIDQWQQHIADYQQTRLKLAQTVQDLEAALQQQSPPDISAISAQLATTEQQHAQLRDTLDNTHALYQRLHKAATDISALHTKNRELEQAYRIYGTLYDVTSGKTGSRISLHRFVLGVLLDDVLIQASGRLSLMSKGRYRLVRKTAGFKGAAGRGLDLSVEDSYTSGTRDVATLSGGESFMAALALALGLSDVVQSYSGGIRLDTLFIDEGFGSLDPESLDLAVQTLVDLQQHGRMIGVISHVSELKEQMAQRIDVQPSRHGSTVSVIGTMS
ncbi:AAA family ATPase [Salinimonas sediminis]|uniref:SMC family ATPase n=1 Tax=Salinimonas sediminis TaxID=2303538 RepID=A0A346NPE7_9ALTE|nr:SMC family ATPase [Salinimonas sediminis]AXR07404.1 SMC family ATPase [Salinimonas sediminis]